MTSKTKTSTTSTQPTTQAATDSKNILKMELKLSQHFGDKSTEEKVSDEDIISSIQFNKTGQFLSLGDHAGRLIVFEQVQTKNKLPEYQYLTELQSHVKEFDYLKSSEIEERVNQVQWLKQQGRNMYMLTANDKTIKLWKIAEKDMKKQVKSTAGPGKLVMPKMQIIEQGIFLPSLQKEFPNLHNYHINSISLSANDDFLLSSDDLRVYLWSVQNVKQTFSVIDLKPDNLEELSEVITSAQYHPLLDNMFLYSTSKGVIKVCDMRKSGVCDNQAITLQEKEDPASKNFFSEIVQSISDATFSANGRYIFSRDFLTVKVWDVNMATQPLITVPIFEPLKSKLCDLYENECIFDKFNIASSHESTHIVTGNFNSGFHVIDRNGEFNMMYELNFNKKTIAKQIPKKYFENLGAKFDFNKKVLRTCFHPKQNIIAVSCLNCLYFYGVQS